MVWWPRGKGDMGGRESEGGGEKGGKMERNRDGGWRVDWRLQGVTEGAEEGENVSRKGKNGLVRKRRGGDEGRAGWRGEMRGEQDGGGR